MDWVKPVVTYSLMDRSIILWMMKQNGARYWGVTDEFGERVIGCNSFKHASDIFDRFVNRLKLKSKSGVSVSMN